MVMAIIQTLIPYVVLLSQVLLVGILIVWFNDLQIKHWIAKHARKLSLFVVTTATLGSLYYSEILHYSPCTMCWYQRIFIFSMIPLFAASLFVKKSKAIYVYGIVSATFGGAIALYHYITQFFGTATSCSIEELAGSCSGKFVFYFGYMTIPLMAVTACLFVIVLCVMGLRDKK
jgi:disulfide bond formation protein DsbB